MWNKSILLTSNICLEIEVSNLLITLACNSYCTLLSVQAYNFHPNDDITSGNSHIEETKFRRCEDFCHFFFFVKILFTVLQKENAAITARETYSYSFCAIVRLQCTAWENAVRTAWGYTTVCIFTFTELRSWPERASNGHSSLMMWQNQDEQWHYKLKLDCHSGHHELAVIRMLCFNRCGPPFLETLLFGIWVFWTDWFN